MKLPFYRVKLVGRTIFPKMWNLFLLPFGLILTERVWGVPGSHTVTAAFAISIGVVTLLASPVANVEWVDDG